jgi:thymidylate synthase (FAD)
MAQMNCTEPHEIQEGYDIMIDNLVINVLNAGFVRLVSYTQPAKAELESDCNYEWTGDLEIVRNARVSYNADWRDADKSKDEKLINYLYANNHSSPFEAMVFTFEVKAPLFVLRQWHRHRTWSYNEVSARYTELPEDFFIPEVLLQQSTGNKQMSSDAKVQYSSELIEAMTLQNKSAFALYKDLMDKGVSREIARTVLPLSTYSRMFATVNLSNLFKFINLRAHTHAQPEIRVYAVALLGLVESVCPRAVAAFRYANSRSYPA